MVKHDEKEHGAGEGVTGVITALYKVNLHCLQCARQIQKPLQKTQGVQKVDVDIESGEIKVKGRVDAEEIHARILKISKKKVEMIQPKIKVVTEKKIVEEKKEIIEAVSSTTILKVHLHCTKCEYDLKRKMLKLKDVYSVTSDTEAQTLAVEGTIDPPKLVEYINKKVRKHAVIVETKVHKKQETVTKKEIDVEVMESKKVTVEGEEQKLEVKVEESISSSTSTSVPYIVHYVYAPQLFSDENPNACYIM